MAGLYQYAIKKVEVKDGVYSAVFRDGAPFRETNPGVFERTDTEDPPLKTRTQFVAFAVEEFMFLLRKKRVDPASIDRKVAMLEIASLLIEVTSANLLNAEPDDDTVAVLYYMFGMLIVLKVDPASYVKPLARLVAQSPNATKEAISMRMENSTLPAPGKDTLYHLLLHLSKGRNIVPDGDAVGSPWKRASSLVAFMESPSSGSAAVLDTEQTSEWMRENRGEAEVLAGLSTGGDLTTHMTSGLEPTKEFEFHTMAIAAIACLIAIQRSPIRAPGMVLLAYGPARLLKNFFESATPAVSDQFIVAVSVAGLVLGRLGVSFPIRADVVKTYSLGTTGRVTEEKKNLTPGDFLLSLQAPRTPGKGVSFDFLKESNSQEVHDFKLYTASDDDELDAVAKTGDIRAGVKSHSIHRQEEVNELVDAMVVYMGNSMPTDHMVTAQGRAFFGAFRIGMDLASLQGCGFFTQRLDDYCLGDGYEEMPSGTTGSLAGVAETVKAALKAAAYLQSAVLPSEDFTRANISRAISRFIPVANSLAPLDDTAWDNLKNGSVALKLAPAAAPGSSAGVDVSGSVVFLETERAGFEKQIDELRKDKRDLSANLASAEARLTSAEKRAGTLQSDVDVLNRELADLRVSSAAALFTATKPDDERKDELALQARINELEAELLAARGAPRLGLDDASGKEKEALRQTIQNLKDNLKASSEAMQAEIDRKEAALTEASAREESLQFDLLELNDQLKDTKRAAWSLKDDLDKATEEKDDQKLAMNDANKKVEDLRRQVADLNSKLLDAAASSVPTGDSTVIIRGLNERLLEAKTALLTMTDKKDKLASELAKHDSALAKIATLNERIKTSDATIDDLTSQIKELKTKGKGGPLLLPPATDTASNKLSTAMCRRPYPGVRVEYDEEKKVFILVEDAAILDKCIRKLGIQQAVSDIIIRCAAVFHVPGTAEFLSTSPTIAKHIKSSLDLAALSYVMDSAKVAKAPIVPIP